jgi:hypothetical protein
MIILETNHAPAISSVVQDNPAYAKGGEACRHAREDVTVAPQVWVFTDCRLTYGMSYVAVIYVSGPHGNELGAFMTINGIAMKATNFFSSLPMIVGTATSSEIRVEFRSVVAGKAWLMIASKPDNVTILSIKNAYGAVGDSSCRRNGVTITSAGHSALLHSCDLASGPKYYLYGYVTDELGNDYGTLSQGLAFVVPPSNRFVAYPEVLGLATPDGLTVRFTPRLSGKAWVVLLEGGDPLPYGIPDIKRAASAVGSPSCIWQNQTIFGGVQRSVALSDCGIDAGMMHRLFVYVEDHANRGDGTLSDPLAVDVGVSNRFEIYPKVVGTPLRNNVTIAFRGSQPNGTAWAIVVAEENARSVNVSTIKAGANAASASCFFELGH